MKYNVPVTCLVDVQVCKRVRIKWVTKTYGLMRQLSKVSDMFTYLRSCAFRRI